MCEYVSYSEQDMEYLAEKDSGNNKCKAIFVELLEEDDEDMKNQIDIAAAVAGICADPTQAGMTVYTLIKESEEMLNGMISASLSLSDLDDTTRKTVELYTKASKEIEESGVFKLSKPDYKCIELASFKFDKNTGEIQGFVEGSIPESAHMKEINVRGFTSKPAGWDNRWNELNLPVNWNYQG